MKKCIVSPVILAILLGSFFFISCSGPLKSAPTAVDKKPTVIYDICPEAKITKFAYPIVEKCEISAKPCVTFEMTVMNVSDKPQRFIANIVLPVEGKGVGGFIPVQGEKDKTTGKRKPPVVEPGKSVTEKYPALQFELPERIEVKVIVMK